METLRQPRPKVEFYDVECLNKECAALMRCQKGDLDLNDHYQPMSRVDTEAYWTMKCPHCCTETVVDLKNTAVKL